MIKTPTSAIPAGALQRQFPCSWQVYLKNSVNSDTSCTSLLQASAQACSDTHRGFAQWKRLPEVSNVPAWRVSRDHCSDVYPTALLSRVHGRSSNTHPAGTLHTSLPCPNHPSIPGLCCFPGHTYTVLWIVAESSLCTMFLVNRLKEWKA